MSLEGAEAFGSWPAQIAAVLEKVWRGASEGLGFRV